MTPLLLFTAAGVCAVASAVCVAAARRKAGATDPGASDASPSDPITADEATFSRPDTDISDGARLHDDTIDHEHSAATARDDADIAEQTEASNSDDADEAVSEPMIDSEAQQARDDAAGAADKESDEDSEGSEVAEDADRDHERDDDGVDHPETDDLLAHPRGGLGSLLGGRARKRLAHEWSLSYARRDKEDVVAEQLVPALARESARHVVSGIIDGRDVTLADISQLGIVGITLAHPVRPIVGIVCDEHEPNQPALHDGQADAVCELGDRAEVYSTDVLAARRFIDTRVTIAAQDLSGCEQVWIHGQFLVAYIDPKMQPTRLRYLIDTLGLIADAAAALPPKNRPAPLPAPLIPTRPCVAAPTSHDEGDSSISSESAVPSETDNLKARVVRPTTPVELPRRQVGEYLGEMELHTLGTDVVEPIAEKSDAHTPPVQTGLRVPRKNTRAPKIFGPDTPDDA